MIIRKRNGATSEQATASKKKMERRHAVEQDARATRKITEFKVPRLVLDAAPWRRPTYEAPGCIIRDGQGVVLNAGS